MNKVVFAFVRMNPPTKGHAILIKKVIETADQERCNYAIVVSHVHDRSRNPLTPERKEIYLRKSFPGVEFYFSDHTCPSMVQWLAGLASDFKNLIMVAGHDRMEEYSRVIQRTNGKDFTFDSIKFVQAGSLADRDEYSATAVRLAAIEGRFEDFKRDVLLNDTDAFLMYNDIRLALGLINTANTEIGIAVHEEEGKENIGEEPGNRGESSIPHPT